VAVMLTLPAVWAKAEELRIIAPSVAAQLNLRSIVFMNYWISAQLVSAISDQ
jgi:hypothetical protein